MSRSKYDIYVKFEAPESGYGERVCVYPTDEQIANALRNYCHEVACVDLDGTPRKIMNLFADSDFIERLMEDDIFVKMVTDIYEDSFEREEDFNNWYNGYIEDSLENE